MKKILFLFIILFVNLVFAEIRINEVELNPQGQDSYNEWLELYSNEKVNLSGWRLINSDGEEKNLNYVFQEYLVIPFEGQWLDNENESIKLINNEGSLVFQTPLLKDSLNNEKTWSYCNRDWVLANPTKGYSNDCSVKDRDSDNANNTNQKKDLELDMDWEDDEIINGDEFYIEIRALNLEDKEYDVKVYIYDDENTLSQTYNENEKKWINSDNYLTSFFIGPGNKVERVKLRIKSRYEDFYGYAKIGLRIKERGSNVYKKEVKDEIEILKKYSKKPAYEQNKTNEDYVSKNLLQETSNKSSNKSSEIIKLGMKYNKTVYVSKRDNVKWYFIYSSIFLMLVLLFLIVIKGFI